MKLKDFKQNYCCSTSIQNKSDIEIVIITKVINKVNGETVFSTRTTQNINTTHNWIADSQEGSSLSKWNWDDVLDGIKRTHLAVIAIQKLIEDWDPHDKAKTPDISDVYCP